MIKVLQVSRHYPPHTGSIETAVRTVVDCLSGEVEMDVLTCREQGEAVSDVVGDTVITRSNTLFTYRGEPFSPMFIYDLKDKAKRADIIHFHLPFPLADFACLLSGFKGKVIVTYYYDINTGLHYFYKPLLHYILGRANMIIAPSQKLINYSEFLSEYADKCTVIPLSVNIEKYTDIDIYPFLRLEYPHNRKVLFVGELTKSKGVDILLSVFKLITGAELFIVGRGDIQEELYDYADKNQLEEKVHFLGNLDDEDLLSAYADCDFFVFPSISDENFGIVQLEAMMFGKPVVNTNLQTGVADVSKDMLTGITVPAGDAGALAGAIQRLINDEELLRIMGNNAYKRVRQYYDAKKNCRELLNIYLSIVAGIDISDKKEKKKRII